MNEELERLLNSDIFDGGQQVVVRSLQTYLHNNRERLNYRGRLFSGQSIGSGVVEGACKNLVGRRLKQTGAYWRQRQQGFYERCLCYRYGLLWDRRDNFFPIFAFPVIFLLQFFGKWITVYVPRDFLSFDFLALAPTVRCNRRFYYEKDNDFQRCCFSDR